MSLSEQSAGSLIAEVDLAGLLKRSFDVAFATAGLFVAAPVILTLAVLVRSTSIGPGFLRQQRVGRDGRRFTLYKLRTMQTDAPLNATHLVSASHITPLGKLLRKTSLDELPQLFNVLWGDMSLVGPRPCLPTQVELVEERHKFGVFSVRPGITGLAQVNKIDMRCASTLTAKDAEYVERQSISFDARIMFDTIRMIARRSGDAS